LFSEFGDFSLEDKTGKTEQKNTSETKWQDFLETKSKKEKEKDDPFIGF
jgi:hypothetical protein